MTVPGKYDGGWPLEIQAGTIYCIYVYIIYIHVHSYRYVHTWYVYIYIYNYICTYIYIYTYTYTYTCIAPAWKSVDIRMFSLQSLFFCMLFIVLSVLPDPFRSRCRFKNIRLCSLPLPFAGSTRHAQKNQEIVSPYPPIN